MELDKAKLEARVQECRSALGGREPSNPYLCIEDFVLQHGQEFQWAPCPEEFRGGEMKECFKNAYQTCLLDEKLRYVEGYARRTGVPVVVLHGWCVDENGKVLDPTWENGTWYFGVIFGRNYVSDVFKARKEYGVLEAWQLGSPLISGKHRYLGDGNVEYDRDQVLNRGRYEDDNS